MSLPDDPDARIRKTAQQVADATRREMGSGEATDGAGESTSGSGSGSVASAAVRMPHGTPSLIAALCNHVAAPGGCVLVFLPGVGEIEEVAEAVERSATAARGGLIVIHVLHSMVGKRTHTHTGRRRQSSTRLTRRRRSVDPCLCSLERFICFHDP